MISNAICLIKNHEKIKRHTMYVGDYLGFSLSIELKYKYLKRWKKEKVQTKKLKKLKLENFNMYHYKSFD